VAWCSEGKKEGGPAVAAAWQREKKERGPIHRDRQHEVASNGPRPSGAGGGAVAQQGRAVGHDRCGAGMADGGAGMS
jgi:hypothetical protein